MTRFENVHPDDALYVGDIISVPMHDDANSAAQPEATAAHRLYMQQRITTLSQRSIVRGLVEAGVEEAEMLHAFLDTSGDDGTHGNKRLERAVEFFTEVASDESQRTAALGTAIIRASELIGYAVLHPDDVASCTILAGETSDAMDSIDSAEARQALANLVNHS